MSKFNLASLKSQFATKSGGETSNNNNYYPFWEMGVGQSAVVRLLPDTNEDNPLGFLVKKMYHELLINGEKKKVPCLKQYDPQAECPICKAAAAFYKSEGKESINGKKYYRKLQFLAQVLVITDPLPANAETGETYAGTVKYVQLGTKIYDSIKDAFESGEFEEVPIDYKEGTNFIIKKTQGAGDFADYTRSKFENKPSSLDDDTIELVTSSIVDLSSLLPTNPGYEKVETMFQAALKGTDYSQGDDTDEGEDEVPTIKSSKAAANVSTKPASKPQPAASDEEIDDEAESILATLRARRQAS